MWSCARGHQETASILYKWNYDALNIKNRSQQTPVDVAKINGYKYYAHKTKFLCSNFKQTKN